MSTEDFIKNQEIKNVRPASGHVGGAFGNENTIVSAGELNTKIGQITVYSVQNLSDNLASIYQMCRDHHIAVILDEHGVYVHSGGVDKENKIGTAVPKYGLYEVDKEFFVESSRTRNIIDSIKKANCVKETNDETVEKALRTCYKFKNKARQTHLRLGSLNTSYIRLARDCESIDGLDTITDQELANLDEIVSIGEAAASRAQPSKSRKRGRNRSNSGRRMVVRKTKYRDDEFCIDLFGPFPASREGFRYGALFLHPKTNKVWVYGCRGRGEFPKILELWLTDLHREYPATRPPNLKAFRHTYEFEGRISKDRVKLIRMDGALELNSASVREIYARYKMDPVKLAPYVHYMNPAERAIQTVNRIAVAILANAKFNDEQFKLLYHEAIREAVELYNLRPNAGVNYKTPYECFHGVRPHIDWTRTWGSTAFILLEQKDRPNGKFSRRFEVGIMMGMHRTTMSKEHPVYRVYIPRRDKFYLRRNVILDETLSHSPKRWDTLQSGEFYIDLTENEHHQVFVPNELPSFEGVDSWGISNEGRRRFYVKEIGEEDDNPIGRTTHVFHLNNMMKLKEKLIMRNQQIEFFKRLRKLPRRSKRIPQPKIFFDERRRRTTQRGGVAKCKDHKVAFQLSQLEKKRRSRDRKLKLKSVTVNENGEKTLEVEVTPECFLALRLKIKKRSRLKKSAILKPRTFKDNVKLSDWDNPDLTWAKLRDDWPEWQDAIEKELNNLASRGTYRELIEGEIPKNVLDTKLVLKIKRNPDGSEDKKKARLTARGFLQQFGLDYHKTSSPVSTKTVVKMILANAKRRKRKTMMIDFCAAFLYPQLKEQIYLQLPDIFGSDSGKIVKLLKTLYGLKQASHEWYNALVKVLKEFGFKQAPEDVDQCLFVHEKYDIELCSHVDDCIISYNDIKGINKLLEVLSERGFEYTESERVTKALGLQISEDETSITLSQPSYVETMLKDYDLQDIPEKKAPPKEWLDKRQPEEKKIDQEKYRSMIGCLGYLAQMTRPDIEQYTYHLATFVSDPGETHLKKLIELMGYLKRFPHRGIRFSIDENQENLWKFYVDSDWAGDLATRKSTTGYIIQFMNGPLVTVSKRQKTVSLSSTEAEYVSFTEVIRDIKWVKKIAEYMKIPFPSPALIRNDNLTAQGIAKGDAKLQRTKHIDTKYHFIREAIELGIVDMIHVPREVNISDMFTHPLGPTLHQQQSKEVLNEKGEEEIAKAFSTIQSIQEKSTYDDLQEKMQELSIFPQIRNPLDTHRIEMTA
jgi:hypothetical protein